MEIAWSGQQLGSLLEEHSYGKNKNHLERDMTCVDGIVLVFENRPRIKWQYGLVEELIRGKDRQIRGPRVLSNIYAEVTSTFLSVKILVTR